MTVIYSLIFSYLNHTFTEIKIYCFHNFCNADVGLKSALKSNTNQFLFCKKSKSVTFGFESIVVRI